MALVKKKLKQKAVHWVHTGPDGRGGNSFDDGVEIDVRWTIVQELFKNAQGEEEMSNAVVRLATDVARQDYLFLGAITDLDSADSVSTNPETITDAKEIRQYSKRGNVRNTEFLRKAWLK